MQKGPKTSLPEDAISLEAADLVYGPRAASYGHPIVNFTHIAEHWKLLIKRMYGVDVPLDARFVALAMIQQKVDRECNKHSRDNLVDIAGFAECLHVIHTALEEKEAAKNE